jgi:hypothetical protein
MRLRWRISRRANIRERSQLWSSPQAVARVARSVSEFAASVLTARPHGRMRRSQMVAPPRSLRRSRAPTQSEKANVQQGTDRSSGALFWATTVHRTCFTLGQTHSAGQWSANLSTVALPISMPLAESPVPRSNAARPDVPPAPLGSPHRRVVTDFSGKFSRSAPRPPLETGLRQEFLPPRRGVTPFTKRGELLPLSVLSKPMRLCYRQRACTRARQCSPVAQR